MKGFMILSALLSVAIARPSVVQLSPLSSLQARASASATASSVPQQLTVLRLVPNLPVDPDSQVLDTIEDNSEQASTVQRAQANAARERARNVLSVSPLVSASSSASASSSLSSADGRVLDALELSLNRAAQAAAQRDEQLRLASQAVQVAQVQSQQQVNGNAASLLSATRLAQTLASLSPTGASSSSSIQVLETPEIVAARVRAQQQQQSAALVTRDSNGIPVLVSSDGQVVGPLIVL